MKTFKEYHEEVKKNAIDQWRKEGHSAFKDMENDPVINLLLSALSYQAYHIQSMVEKQEENTLRKLCDRIIPFHLTKAVPAFSIVETKLIKAKNSDEAITEKIVDEACSFEFKKSNFVSLLETKIIQAEIKTLHQEGKSLWIELQLDNPIKSLSGLSFYINNPETTSIEAIRFNDEPLPLIKPSLYNELPFTSWFNNAHLLLNGNHHLFGTYDYWQELFLTNTVGLFYIGQYDTKKTPLNGQNTIQLEIIFDSFVDESEINLKINCIPVVNVEKESVVLNDRNSAQELSSDNGEFLNLLYNEDMEKNRDEFLVRQHGVERYNSKQLLEQMQELLYRYDSDFYAFQFIPELRYGDKLKKMQEIVDEISGIVNKFEDNQTKTSYYAVLKKKKAEKNVYLEYLTTSGASIIRKGEKASKAPLDLDRDKTVFLMDAKGGRNSIQDQTQKENIAKYYFQTKDRLVTPADITCFVRSFYYNEDSKLGDDIENLSVEKKDEQIVITINLIDDSALKNMDEAKKSLGKLLQSKINLKSTGIMNFQVEIY